MNACNSDLIEHNTCTDGSIAGVSPSQNTITVYCRMLIAGGYQIDQNKPLRPR